MFILKRGAFWAFLRNLIFVLRTPVIVEIIFRNWNCPLFPHKTLFPARNKKQFKKYFAYYYAPCSCRKVFWFYFIRFDSFFNYQLSDHSLKNINRIFHSKAQVCGPSLHNPCDQESTSDIIHVFVLLLNQLLLQLSKNYVMYCNNHNYSYFATLLKYNN